MKTVLMVGHDNYGSREIFTRTVDENKSEEVRFILFITTGLYYKKSFVESIVKMLREASFLFCLMRFLESVFYMLKGDTLKKRALERNVDIFYIDDINSEKSHKIIKEQEVDLLVSMFTMQIYNQSTISKPTLGSIGTHPSILPEYRGLEVFFWMLANQEKSGGVSVFFLDKKIDAGKVFLQEKFLIRPDETVDSIYKKLTKITARMVSAGVKQVLAGGEYTFVKSSGKGCYYPMPTRKAFKRFMKTDHKWFGETGEEVL